MLKSVFFVGWSRLNNLSITRHRNWICPSKKKELPAGILQLRDVEKVMRQIDSDDLPLGLRNRAMFELLYATGLRRSELVNLDLNDVGFDKRRLHVRKGKGGKDRVVPVTLRALSWLETYLEDARSLLDTNQTDAVFLNRFRRSTFQRNGDKPGPWFFK